MTISAHRGPLLKIDWYVIAWLAVASAISIATGCHDDECEDSAMKCNGNILMECDPDRENYFGYAHWDEMKDCTKFGATCREGVTPHYDPSTSGGSEPPYSLDYYSHGCALDGYACDGDTDMQCSEDNSLIVGCSYSHEPAAMIIAENKRNLPLCVERPNGFAGFAYLPGECQSSQESTCLNDSVTIRCEDSLWTALSTKCARYTDPERVCEESEDSDGHRIAQCVPVDP